MSKIVKDSNEIEAGILNLKNDRYIMYRYRLLNKRNYIKDNK